MQICSKIYQKLYGLLWKPIRNSKVDGSDAVLILMVDIGTSPDKLFASI